MSDPIRVRLVPKDRSQTVQMLGSFSAGKTSLPPGGLADHSLARTMLAESHKLGLQPTISPLGNRIDSIVSPERFQELFQAKLEPRSFEEERGLRGLYSVSAEKKVLLPTSELKVPVVLVDEVSFAYVPTPPSFFGLQFVPPPASFYYLRIEDVARGCSMSTVATAMVGPDAESVLPWPTRDSSRTRSSTITDSTFSESQRHLRMTQEPMIRDTGRERVPMPSS